MNKEKVGKVINLGASIELESDYPALESEMIILCGPTCEGYGCV